MEWRLKWSILLWFRFHFCMANGIQRKTGMLSEVNAFLPIPAIFVIHSNLFNLHRPQILAKSPKRAFQSNAASPPLSLALTVANFIYHFLVRLFSSISGHNHIDQPVKWPASYMCGAFRWASGRGLKSKAFLAFIACSCVSGSAACSPAVIRKGTQMIALDLF